MRLDEHKGVVPRPSISCHGNSKYLKLCSVKSPKGKCNREDSQTLVANTINKNAVFPQAVLQLNSKKQQVFYIYAYIHPNKTLISKLNDEMTSHKTRTDH